MRSGSGASAGSSAISSANDRGPCLCPCPSTSCCAVLVGLVEAVQHVAASAQGSTRAGHCCAD